MSLFQCDKCGCLEKTALTGGYHMRHYFRKRPDGIYEEPSVTCSYRQVLGLKEDEEFGAYCSACNPIWYTETGHHGFGPRPEGYVPHGAGLRDGGVWHGQFERRFLPKGLFHTDEQGNLRHIETLQTPEESGLEAPFEYADAPRYAHPDWRLPAHDPEDMRRWRTLMNVLAPNYWGEGDDAAMHRAKIDGRAGRGGLPALVKTLVEGKVEVEFSDPKSKEQGLLDRATAAFSEAPAFKEAPRAKGRRHRRLSSAAAGIVAMASMVGAYEPAPRRRREEVRREPTEEERRAAAERGEAKRAAAEAKRRQKAEKRQKQAERVAEGKARLPVTVSPSGQYVVLGSPDPTTKIHELVAGSAKEVAAK